MDGHENKIHYRFEDNWQRVELGISREGGDPKHRFIKAKRYTKIMCHKIELLQYIRRYCIPMASLQHKILDFCFFPDSKENESVIAFCSPVALCVKKSCNVYNVKELCLSSAVRLYI